MTLSIIPITLRAANDFVQAHHRHNGRTSNDGGKFAIGLEREGMLVGVAIVGRPISRELQKDRLTAELLRCCVSIHAPLGSPSKLNTRAKRIWQLMGGKRWVSYNLKTESGVSMRASGLEVEAEVKGRQWNGEKRGDRPVAEVDKFRWGAQLAEIPA